MLKAYMNVPLIIYLSRVSILVDSLAVFEEKLKLTSKPLSRH